MDNKTKVTALEKAYKEKDKCVVCKKETPYITTTHIDKRINYVEGSGQLCSKCWSFTYLNKKKEI
tara:strand:- start:6 stop:200 length:195 start_codon:yes stop_codon:yes gene_type:complete